MGERDRDLWERAVQALERLAPNRRVACDWKAAPAYLWDGSEAHPIERIRAPRLDQLRGIDEHKRLFCENLERHARGHAAHDILLWGARGMGKSALVRAAARDFQEREGSDNLALLQISAEALSSLPWLMRELAPVERQFLALIDDIGFSAHDPIGPHVLRSWLEGGVETRGDNLRLAVTSNRRAIVERRRSEQDEHSLDAPLHARDAIDDALALADRFGLVLGFHPCSQELYLEILAAYAAPLDLRIDRPEALEWAARKGQRSGRVAWQYIVELAGRAGIAAPQLEAR